MLKINIYKFILFSVILSALWPLDQLLAQVPLEDQKSESVVVVPDEKKQEFIEDNNLKNKDLKPVPELEDTYIVKESTAKLKSDTRDVTVAPRRQYSVLLVPNDPIYPQYATDKIAAPGAWDITTGSTSITTAVIDTGFGLGHEDLNGRWDTNSNEIGSTSTEGPAPNCSSQSLPLNKNCNNIDDDGNGFKDDWRGWDFAQSDNNPNAGSTNPSGDGVSHGTITAGLVGATGNNSKGVASVNWGTKILPLQALSDDGEGYTEDLVSAINYAVARQVKVINLSLGSTGNDSLVEQAISNAVNAGVTVIAAAGNCGDGNYALNGCDFQGQILYPAKYSAVIAVGASDANDNRASFSSYGSEIDVVAPGSGTLRSTSWSQSNQTTLYTSSANGTSFASPIVAGVAAAYKGLAPGASASEIKNAIENSADRVPGMQGQNFTHFYGYGRVNAERTAKLATIIHPDGTLIINRSSGAVYLVEGGQKRYIPDPAIFSSYYKDILQQAKTATPSDLQLANGPSLGFRSGVVIKGSGLALYAVNDNSGTMQKHYIPSPAVHNTLGFNEAERVQVSDGFLYSLPEGTVLSTASRHPNGSVVIAPDKITVSLITGDQRRHISHPWALMSLNKGKYFIKPATAADMALPPGDPLDFEEGAIIKGSGPAIYIISNNGGVIEKRHVISPFIYNLLNYQNNEWMNVPDDVLPTENGPLIN